MRKLVEMIRYLRRGLGPAAVASERDRVMREHEVQHYEVVPGKLYAGEYPGWPASDQELARFRLASVAGKGIATFIDLTTSQDGLDPYVDLLPEVGHGLNRLSFPVPDMGVPDSTELMTSILATIRTELETGRSCYVHCWGGIGRTGTVVGCYFREQGLGPDEALGEVQRLYAAGMPKVVRHPRSPQTVAQSDYVRSWGTG